MKKIYKLLMVFLLSTCFNLTKAQTNDTLEIQRGEKGRIEFARFKPNDTRKLKDGPVFLKSVLKAKKDDSFNLLKETTDKFGISHYRYQQYYKKIKVDGAEYLIHGKNENIETINGNFQEITTSTTATVNEAQALTKALAFVNAKKYKWEDAGSEKFLKLNTNNSQSTYYPKGELMIAKDYLKGTKGYKLAWMFTISSIQPNKEQLVYVDAITGEIINTRSLIEDTNISCTAETLYSGTLGIVGDSFSSGFRLQESRNGVSVRTLNLQGSTSISNAIDFVNSSTINEFTANVAQGTNGFEEANALNEGLSDIWGACVESTSTTNKQTWLIGEDLFTSTFNCIRNLQNPKSNTAYEGQHPDTYHGTFWNNNGEPHFNSTILSHWFYLLSQGGNGTNDNNNTFNVTTIGMTDASRIVYQAETNYLHAGSTYNDARTATISAATDIFGSGSCQVINVTNAWYAVGVGSPYSNTSYSIVGSNEVCSSGNFYIFGLPSGATINWSVSGPASLTQSNNVATLTRVSDGTATLTATITTSCGTVSATPREVQVGTPQFTSISQGPGVMCPGDYATFNVSVTGNNVTYNWTYDTNTLEPGITPTGTGPQLILRAKANFTGGFAKLTVSNNCGTTSQYAFWSIGRSCQSGYSYTAYPNPATDQLTVSAPPDDTNSSNQNSVSSDAISTPKSFEIKLYDNKAKIWRSAKNKDSARSLVIDTRDIPKGNYFLHIIEGKSVIKQQIIIEH
ncbi:MAG: hypothetical protein EOP45_03615 [Sphingobacteriaceae bacterium]|nr:MAG: hypothetical protein EOP45_03615 [Sphingobacteriaceae bacterium]